MTASDSITFAETVKLNLVCLVSATESITCVDRLPKQKVQINYNVGRPFLTGTITATKRFANNRFVLVTYSITRSWGNEIRRRLVFV